MWHASWGGLPPESFFERVDPFLAPFRRAIPDESFTADNPVGHLSPEWAERFGLPETVVVAGGIFDGHCGAVGADPRPEPAVRRGVPDHIVGAGEVVLADRRCRGRGIVVHYDIGAGVADKRLIAWLRQGRRPRATVIPVVGVCERLRKVAFAAPSDLPCGPSAGGAKRHRRQNQRAYLRFQNGHLYSPFGAAKDDNAPYPA